MRVRPVPIDCGAPAFGEAEGWFVYLLALTDCSAFKVGFSCNPLQRIYSFSHRYFERFDLHQSSLLQLGTLSDARLVEFTLKKELAPCRVDCPSWVPSESGGHTEWFSAVHFEEAEERFRALLSEYDAARLGTTFAYVRGELVRMSPAFEIWSWRAVQQVGDWRVRSELGGPLRDWLDAYRYFHVALFVDDPDVREFVSAAGRH